MTFLLGSTDRQKMYVGGSRVTQAYMGGVPLFQDPPMQNGLIGWWDDTSIVNATNWRNRVGDARLDLTDTNNAGGLQVAQINGLNGIQNTADAYLRSASLVDVATPATLFMVVRLDRTNTASQLEFISDSHSTGNSRLLVAHGDNIGSRAGLRYIGSTTTGGTAYDGFGPRQQFMPLVMTTRVDTTSSFRVSGLGEETLTGSNDVIRTFRLFSDLSSARYSRATIGEILLYDRALSNNERASVEGYLEGKWGVTYPMTDVAWPDAWYSDATLPGGAAQVISAWPNNYQLNNQWDLLEAGTAGGFRTFIVSSNLVVIDSNGSGRLDTALQIPQTAPFTFVGVIRPNSNAAPMMWNDGFGGSNRVIQIYDGSVPDWSMQRDRSAASGIAGGDTLRRVVSFAYTSSGDNIARVGGHGSAINVTNTSGATVDMMRLYADSVGGRRFIGRVMEFAYWNRRLTDQQVLDIEAFLRTKWSAT